MIWSHGLCDRSQKSRSEAPMLLLGPRSRISLENQVSNHAVSVLPVRIEIEAERRKARMIAGRMSSDDALRE